MDINLIIVAVYSYLLGSIPFGLILTKIFLKKFLLKQIQKELTLINKSTLQLLLNLNPLVILSKLVHH